MGASRHHGHRQLGRRLTRSCPCAVCPTPPCACPPPPHGRSGWAGKSSAGPAHRGSSPGRRSLPACPDRRYSPGRSPSLAISLVGALRMIFGRHQRALLLGRAHGGLVGHIGRVRFGRDGEIDGRLRQRQLALRRAEEIIGVLGGVAPAPAPADRPGRYPPPPCAPGGARYRAGLRRHPASAPANTAPHRDRSRAPIYAAR